MVRINSNTPAPGATETADLNTPQGISNLIRRARSDYRNYSTDASTIPSTETASQLGRKVIQEHFE